MRKPRIGVGGNGASPAMHAKGPASETPLPLHRSLSHTLAVIWLVVVLIGGSACTSPTAPTRSSVAEMGVSPAGSGTVPSVPNGGEIGQPAPTVTNPACQVSQEDLDHARRILRILTNELQRGIPLVFALEEVPFTSPRILHGQLVKGSAGELEQWISAALEKNTLRFGSPEAAGYALWDAAGQLTIVADIYVNGVKVQGCTPRTGKITGRIDLDGL